MHPDNKYIIALLENNSILLKELYEKYFSKIKLMVIKNGGTEDDAADMMQEGLVSIYNRACSAPFQLTCPMEAFLYHVCKNKWISFLRKKNSRDTVTITDHHGYILGEDEAEQANRCAADNEKKNLFEEKFKELGQACQQLLQLNWSGKPLDEVATLMNTTYAYIRKKKSECMAKLMTLVQQSPVYENLKWR